MTSFTRQLVAAIQGHLPLPEFPPDLQLADAYVLQHKVAQLVSHQAFGGIKAGVTAPQLQKVFGIDHALLGHLYQHGALADDATITCPPGQLIECEIGITVDAAGNPVSAGPAIEFAFAAFTRPQDATAANLTAANVAADRYLPGRQLPWRDSYEGIVVRLYRNDELINSAPITESLGGPAAATNWIVREALQYGFEITNDTLLMTGACGKVLPALPGRYVANYGELGQLTFNIT